MKANELPKMLEDDLRQYLVSVTAYAPLMFEIIEKLPKDPAFKRLDRKLREEIEQVITAIE